MIKSLAEILFYGLMILLAVYSSTLVYVILRFGKSKVLGFILSLTFVLILFSLFGVANVNFQQIPFTQLTEGFYP